MKPIKYLENFVTLFIHNKIVMPILNNIKYNLFLIY
uniref:Uncharacterized protein n=1 Tax=viral metagenome TaxID=1070528 RepID=A0A6C0H937_9ZZZZ